MKAKEPRLCIYPKDVQRITGKSYRQCTRILRDIRLYFEKPVNSWITVSEFCMYTGLPYEEVVFFLD